MVLSKNVYLALSIFIVVTFLSFLGVPASYGVIQGHGPLVIQGHSPIVLLVADPNGYQIGCIAAPCNSTSSSNFVDTIPTCEGPATYNFTSNSITIANATPGTWTVKYIGTGATTSTPFTITAMTCPETYEDWYKGHQEHGCCPSDHYDNSVAVTLLSGTVEGSQTGSLTFLLNSNDSIGSITVKVPIAPEVGNCVQQPGTPIVGFATFNNSQGGQNLNVQMMLKGSPGTYQVQLKYLIPSQDNCKGTAQVLGTITIKSNGQGEFHFNGNAISGTHEFDLVVIMPGKHISYATPLTNLTLA